MISNKMFSQIAMAKYLTTILALSVSLPFATSTRRIITSQCQDGSVCHNGGSCILAEGNSGTYECNCTSMETVAAHAGITCEHEATDYCVFNTGSGTKHSFCTNGRCKQIYQAEEGDEIEHRGCICDEGFEGDYCELETPAMLDSNPQTTPESNTRTTQDSKSQTTLDRNAQPTTHVGMITFISVLLTSVLISTLIVQIERKKTSPPLAQPGNQPKAEVV